jgi:adenine-specific DNA-methyltransferase
LASSTQIYINNKTGRIEEIGKELDLSENRNETKDIPGCTKVFPVKPDGTEMVWGVTKPTLEKKLRKGYVKVTRGAKARNDFTIYYLTSGQEKDILDGKILVVGNEEDGSVKLAYETGKHSLPTTQWSRDSHNAQTNGSNLLKALLPDRSFPFPKSLYAVEDALRIVIGNNKEATVLDFFAGSGTTSHALMRLNKYDSGRRQCILVTNNEVSAEEQRKFREDGLRPGDDEWERWGICELITKPRIRAAITGMTSEGKTIEGDYKFNNEFPIKDGFEENAEFFTLTYQTPITISHNLAFENISPLLWMRAGSLGRRIISLPTSGWEVADTYGLLIDLDKTSPFVKAIKARDSIRLIYIVTNDDRRFQSVVRLLPNSIEPVRLYESYLKNFQFKSDL